MNQREVNNVRTVDGTFLKLFFGADKLGLLERVDINTNTTLIVLK